MISVAIYLVDQEFGGSEEGGWWFSSGYPDEDFMQYTKHFKYDSHALNYIDKLHKKVLPALNEGRPHMSSVLSRGEYRAVMCEGYPRAFPESRPHYS
jgi:hypothetical protein